MKNKKGQLGGIVGVVSALLIIGVLIGSGFVILQTFFEEDSLKDTSVTATDNNAWINATTYTLDGASDTAFNSVSITSIVNATDGVTILSGNYSVSSAGIVSNATATTWSDVNITYTYNMGETSYTAMNDSIEAMTTVPSLLGVLILVIIVGIILAIIFGSFPGNRGGA